MKIALEFEAELLSSTAMRLGVRPEELARAALTDVLNRDKEEFYKAAEYVLEKIVRSISSNCKRWNNFP